MWCCTAADCFRIQSDINPSNDEDGVVKTDFGSGFVNFEYSDMTDKGVTMHIYDQQDDYDWLLIY